MYMHMGLWPNLGHGHREDVHPNVYFYDFICLYTFYVFTKLGLLLEDLGTDVMSRQFEHLGIDWTMSLASSPLAKKHWALLDGFVSKVALDLFDHEIAYWNCNELERSDRPSLRPSQKNMFRIPYVPNLGTPTFLPQKWSFPSIPSLTLITLSSSSPGTNLYLGYIIPRGWNVICFWNPGSLFTEPPSSQNLTSHRGGQHHGQHMSTLFLPAPCRQLVPGCCVCSDQSYHCRTTLLEFSDFLVRWLAMTHALVHESTFFLVRNQQNMATPLGTKSFRELFNLWNQRPLLHGSTSTVFAQAHIESSNSCG